MILDGRQFTACDIVDIVGAGADVALAQFLEYDEPRWRPVQFGLASLKVKLNSLCASDANQLSDTFTPQMYKKGDGLFTEVQQALAPVAFDPRIVDAVSRLELDTGPLAGSSINWLRPALVAGGLGGVAVLGYLWTRSSVAPRRRSRR